jgi:nitrogen fixation protein FixH
MVGVLVAIAGCGQPQPASQNAAEGAARGVVITVRTDPDPVRAGENTLEATVVQDGKPVTDATVSTEFFMAAMPAMKMPEMRTTADLAHEGNGTYRGKTQVTMAGSWDVTVTVMRGGQEIGRTKTTVLAK